MQPHENARPAANGTGGNQAGETRTTSIAARRAQRWASAHLDELLDVPPPAADPIDYAAVGLTLTVAERTAVGAVHPWRVAA
ncbi:hypothetical protein FXF53_20530 [Micromonospora sp. WP24]|uniref:hypothetical protein n=1 Tax=Micromonospora sp. WP24 TaxID=2604469 RepID=UPI0011D52F5D|nr:hypothetical protein [Micromonospora sp. WP24]TYB97133.1 hypothetical protein FXF53_20530 [Micromonospora sp. WP24]